MDPTSSEFHKEISSLAVANCCEEFCEAANVCANAIMRRCPTFDGSYLTLLMQELHPDLIPNPDKIAYHKNGTINRELTFEIQRNYYTSAATVFLAPRGVAAGKRKPLRRGSHDMVTVYTSRGYQPRARIDYGIETAMRAVGIC